MYYQVFIAAFIVVATAYSILAAATKIFYKDKPISELSEVESDILFDRAKFITRIGVFFLNFAGSIISPQVLSIVELITLIIYLINLVI